ncbi:MAG: outer membrane protein precursor [Bacteroidota bacterium]
MLRSPHALSQDFKWGIEHLLTVNDFVSPNSPAHLNLKEMPRGMELGLNYRFNKIARLSFPFRTGFGKALSDTLGRTFVGLDTRLLIEKQFDKITPFIASGIGAQLLSSKWDIGIPIIIGFSIPFDEGFRITLSSNYRRSFRVEHHSWTHGIGLGFRFNAAKSKSNYMPSVPFSATESKEGDAPMEVFRADDSEQQQGIITPTAIDEATTGMQSSVRTPKGFSMGRLDTLMRMRIALSPLAVHEDPYKAFRINGLLDSSLLSNALHRDTSSDLLLGIYRPLTTVTSLYPSDISSSKAFRQGASKNKKAEEGAFDAQKGQWMTTVYFEWDAFSLTQASRWTLTMKLEKYAAVQELWLVGHADNQGNDTYNLDLSRKRVESVKKELVKRGIPAHKMKVAFYGESQPIQSNNTPQGRKANRRVEIFYLLQNNH